MVKKYDDEELVLREPGTLEAMWYAAQERARWLR